MAGTTIVTTLEEGFSALFKDGHKVVKKTNSGMDAGLNKRGKFSRYQVATPKWIGDNVCDSDIHKLLAGKTVGVSVKRGRGYSYIELTRYSKEDAKKILNNGDKV